jgi:drug/metabolite transporter (DMT)-like permease
MTAFFSASLCFGVMAVLVRLASAHLGPVEIACVRFTGAFLLLVATTRGRGLRPQRASFGPLVLRGALGATAIGAYFVGIARAGAGLATLVHSTYPVFTALWGVVFLGDRLTWGVIAALALSVAGAGVVLHDQLHAGPDVLAGIAAALAGGMLAGGAVTTAGELRRTESASLVTVWFMAVGAVLTAPALLDGFHLPAPAVALTLAGVVVTSTAGQWLLHHGLGFVSPTVGSLAAATGVVTAAGLEALVTGRGIGGGVVVGGTLMLAAVGLARVGEDRQPRAGVARGDDVYGVE